MDTIIEKANIEGEDWRKYILEYLQDPS
jgi:hypothetical protein